MVACVQKCMKSCMIKHRKTNWIFTFHMQEKIDDIHDECVHVVKTAGEEEVWDEQEYRSKIDNLHTKAKSIWLNAFNGGGSPKHLGNNLFEELNLQV